MRDLERRTAARRRAPPRRAPPARPRRARPCAARIRKKPTRVQFAAMPSTTMREPGTSTAAAAWKAAEEGSPGTWIASSASDSTPGHAHAVAVAPHGHAGARQQPLRVVAARLGLDDRRRAVGQQPGQQHAALDLRRGDGQRVLDARERAGRRRRAAGSGPRARRAAAPMAASGRATRSTGRRRIDASPSSVQRPAGWPASQPGSSRSSVPALPTSIAAPGAAPRRPGAVDHQLAGPALLHARAERGDGGERGARVGRVEVARDVDGLGAHRPEQRGAVGDRLVRRRA